MKELYGRYKSQGLVLIGVHSDDNAAEMKKAVKTHKITWPIAQDTKGKTLKAYESNAFPTYALVDRKGKLRVMDVEPEELERVIKLLLKEKA